MNSFLEKGGLAVTDQGQEGGDIGEELIFTLY
jgi:hypothetical protein